MGAAHLRSVLDIPAPTIAEHVHSYGLEHGRSTDVAVIIYVSVRNVRSLSTRLTHPGA